MKKIKITDEQKKIIIDGLEYLDLVYIKLILRESNEYVKPMLEKSLCEVRKLIKYIGENI